jgi:NAD(P)-dependent dehydrogenase (short-subunit alcohol dehydrogenase family)
MGHNRCPHAARSFAEPHYFARLSLMHSLSQRVVLITGAVGNLGRAIARAAQNAGARTVLVDRAADRLHHAYADLVVSTDHLLLGGVNLADESAAGAAFGSAVDRFGRVDALVNTVGTWRGGLPTHEAPLADWELLFEANVRPTLLACRAAVPHFLARQHGRIVNIAARSGLAGDAGSAAYSAAKSSVLRLTEALSAEVKHAGVNVNALLPSTIDTPQNRAAMPSADPATWVEPEALADVVLFLISDAARAIHGAAIPVYGRA